MKITDLRLAAKYASFALSKPESLIFGDDRPHYPPVFVIGPPRSGSTLFFQSMCHTFKCSYPVSFLRYAWLSPALGTWALKTLGKEYSSDFRSKYGLGTGLFSPYSLNTMNLMLGRNEYPVPEEIDNRSARYLIGTLGRIERVMNAPFISKNQRYNQWVRVLAELFPTSIFLVLLRGPFGVALSLLRARQELYGDLGTWYLEKPRTYPFSDNASPEEQVVGQIWGIVEDIRMDMESIGTERFATLHYEDLCQDPVGLLSGVQLFLEKKGIPLLHRQELPERFETVSARTDGLDQDQIQKVEEVVSRLFPSGKISSLPCQEIKSIGSANRTGQVPCTTSVMGRGNE